MFFVMLDWTSLVSSLICCWSKTLGTAVDEEEDALEEEEKETDVAVGDEKEEEVELGRIDEEGPSIFIPLSELAQEMAVETLEEVDDLLFLLVEEGLIITSA